MEPVKKQFIVTEHFFRPAKKEFKEKISSRNIPYYSGEFLQVFK